VGRIQRELGDDYRWVEWQANAFAGLVLVPRNLLREKVAYHESRAKAAGFPPSVLYEGEGFHRLVQSLSESFGVSREPIEIRLSKDNFI
jgi:Zn-dependent peptidase ImmA (M78 family)